MYGDFEAVIGLEIHAQLSTQSKLFAPAATTFGAGDNENVSLVCAGMPGVLPVLNKAVVELAIKTGLALNCEIQNGSTFARKQYFYPDLPKGYQISQFDKPICGPGYVDYYLSGEKKRVQIERAHLEEDAGKSTHFGEFTLINLNRAGVPLLEIVSAPVMSSPQEASGYARAVRQILIYSDVCNGNLEEGSMRCDCNVSVRKVGDKTLGTRVELKNINSFRFIEKAIEYEIHRQIDCIQYGDKIIQETRLYDSTKNKTFSMRSKEAADDYRYFRDPDIVPLNFDTSIISKLGKELPEMPIVKMERFLQDYGLAQSDCELLCAEQDMAIYFEQVAEVAKDPKLSANWIVGEILARANEAHLKFNELPVSAKALGELLGFISDGSLSGKMAKTVLDKMWNEGGSAEYYIESLGLVQITDDKAILSLVLEIFASHPEKVAEYRSGKEKLYGFFVGQVMKKTGGQASPAVVNKILKTELGKQ